MIVCLCMVCSESEIRECIQAGACSLEEVEQACGAGSSCQSCHPEILALLSEGIQDEKDIPDYRSAERSAHR